MSAMRRRELLPARLLRLLGAVMTALAICILLMAIFSLGRDSGESGRRQLENSVRRTVMACYAQEGVYPPDVDYLKEHYGLQTNEDRYQVYYTVYGENVMPEITVLERGK